MTLNCIYWQTEEARASAFLPTFEVLYLCGFHGDPTFLSYILPEMNVLNTCAKFEVKISVQNEWQHEPLTIYNTRLPNGGRACADESDTHARPPNGHRTER